jgi:CheY-like chemotaxis protein
MRGMRAPFWPRRTGTSGRARELGDGELIRDDATPQEPPLERPAAEDARSPGETWRILFLDKVESVEQLKGACKDAGYVVVGATTIEEAFAFLDGKDHADVIVCAAHLEEESMFEFLRRVRDSEIHKDVSFLILSLAAGETGSRLDRSAARAGILLGADSYLIMPVFDPVVLLEHVQRLRPRVPLLQQSANADEKRRAQ